MTHCSRCKAKYIMKKEIIYKFLKNICVNYVNDIILQYNSYAKLNILHSQTLEAGQTSYHYIFNICMGVLTLRAIDQDTPLILCPACPRIVYIG